ncbi:hypothetical protein C8R47DRAFT_1110051 [Mycena vitilis]|nr:hypothetical protein C8R47DRAFT_1110051 [Mycena vitilis]
MDSNGSRVRPFDKPDAGLTPSEWATKVKDMHRHTDPNEEADQKRLEDEIAASRLARLRRSRGLGSGSRTNSLDLSKSKDYSSALRSQDTTSTDDHKSPADRQKSQAEALDKLMGSTSLPEAKEQPAAATSGRPEPMSLAAFIGGKATGPRLNRHAPQQDAHDPTQFVQRTANAPHPIFGRGGIAMPGMAAARSARGDSDQQSVWSRAGRTPEPKDRRLSTPSPEKLDSPPVSPQRASVRERTLSTPSGTSTARSNPIPAPQPTRDLSATSQSRSYSNASHSNGSPVPGASRPFTPREQPSSPPAVGKSPVVTPSLARPIQPDPRTSPHGPQISISQSPSLAFLRPPTQKDPTPSLSRLQGRGFVQNMVKANSQLESPPPNPTEKNRPTSGRKSSVLDRWPSPAASPPPSPTAVQMRRSRTVESPAPSSVRFGQMSKSYSDSGTAQPDEAAGPVERIAGVGSSRTMVVSQPKVFGVDEHGFKRGDEPGPRPSKVSSLPEPTKPLIHPTKARAKKPKKSKSSAREDSQSPPSQSPSAASTASTSFAPSPSLRSTNLVDNSALPEVIHSHPPIPLNAAVSERTPPMSVSNGGSGMVGRRALPGMTQGSAPQRPAISPKPTNLVAEPDLAPRALPGLASAALPSSSQQDDMSSFGQLGRLPSSGRPTAMDVAQAFADPPRKLSPTPPVPPPVDDKPAEPTNVPAARPRNMMPPSAQSEKRKSSYERYSMFLPPLKEEATPDPTPNSTLTRAVGNAFVQPDFDLVTSKLVERENIAEVTESVARPEDGMLHFTHADEPLPWLSLAPLLTYIPPGPSTDAQTIQVDVMAIAGSTAFPLGSSHTFYDTEILAIIHRSKSNSTGLTSSTVWSWQGKNSGVGDSEERKLAELAKRYGTSIVPVRQLSEPVELVKCLGGTLAIRQGSRAHWANDNTAMHIVRSMDGLIFIDQVDIDIKNICSGFSYCVSILNTLFIWHGCGSTSVQRDAALDYGRSLTSNPEDMVVLVENENDDDEMFWMVLGDEAEYAKADYWKWRSSISVSPRIWSVDAGRKNILSLVQSFRQEHSPSTSVYIMDCVFEFFVLVPADARGKRRDIRLALSVAMDAATRLAPARPYTPTVHALILPSQLPVDLRIQFRDLEDVFLNEASAEHMNILSSRDAETHLQTWSWTKSQLKDKTMLPLGLDESHIS